MVAATSCPRTRGKVTNGFLPRKVFRSVPQRPIILICNKASRDVDEGSGMSIRVALPGSCTAMAFTVFSYFQIVDSGCCRSEDVCALVIAEVRKEVAEKLPPLHVVGGHQAYGPIGACQQALGAKCVDYRVKIGPQGF